MGNGIGLPQRLHATRIVAMAAALTCLLPATGQEKATRLIFDVASIRPTRPGQLTGGIKAYPGGHGYLAQNMPVKLMISVMYKVPMRQISGGPAWLDTEPFDVQAKADHPYSLDNLHLMYQNLLADRFGLSLHTVSKEGPVYALTVDSPGLKMKPNLTAQDYEIPVTGPPQHTVGKRVPMKYFCWWLGQALQHDERPVLDRTGLEGNYDWLLSFRPELPPDVSADALSSEQGDLPSIFVALKEQLGLKLQPQRGPVEYLVIDHIEKPSEN